MLFKPLLGTSLSGSVGGITASHNRGGTYFRNRAIPTNPNTPQQATVRGLMAQLANLWNDTLTSAQRTAWDEYAAAVLLPGPNGDPRNVGGLGQYVRSNLPRLQASLPRVDLGPSILNLGDYTIPTIASVTAATDLLSLNFTEADDWVGEDDAAMLVYTSRGQNATINFFKGPYRFAATILGDSSTPPTTPASVALAFGVAVGQKTFIRVTVTRADGRLATQFRDVIVAV